MMANTLEEELQEAIQRYADKHWNGALEMSKITVSLSKIAGGYFAEIPLPTKRVGAFNIFMELTARETNARASISNAQKGATG